MRKYLSMIVALALSICFSFTGCDKTNIDSNNSNRDSNLTQTNNIKTEQKQESQKMQIITGTNVCENGDYVFYRNTNDNGSLYRYNTKDDSYIKLFDKNYNAFLHSISVYNNYVYFVTRVESDKTPTLYRVSIDGGKAERLFDNVGDDYIITEDAIYYTDSVCEQGDIFGLHKYTLSEKSDILLNSNENRNLSLKGNKLFYICRDITKQTNTYTFEVLDITDDTIKQIPMGDIEDICYVSTLNTSEIIFFAAYYNDGKMQLASYNVNTNEYNLLSEKFYVINGIATVSDDLVYFQAFTQERGSTDFYASCTVYEWKNGKTNVYADLNGNDLYKIESVNGKPVLFSKSNSGNEKILGDDRFNVVVEE